MGEFASKGGAYGVGIPALALGGLAFLQNNGGLGGLLGGGNCNNGMGAAEVMAMATPLIAAMANKSNCHEPCETKEAAVLRSENATLRAEKYADGVGLGVYEKALAIGKQNDDLIRANQKEAFGEIVSIRERLATNDANTKCLTAQVAENTGSIKTIQHELCELGKREVLMGANLSALASDTKQGLALEAERRASADEAIRCWVKGTYVPGSLSLSPDSMCPKPVTCCDVLTYFNAGGKPPVPSPCGCGGCSAPVSAKASA